LAQLNVASASVTSRWQIVCGADFAAAKSFAAISKSACPSKCLKEVAAQRQKRLIDVVTWLRAISGAYHAPVGHLLNSCNYFSDQLRDFMLRAKCKPRQASD